MSSASNLATAVLRGIDTQRIGKVNDLPRILTSGKLRIPDHPEASLELPPDFARSQPLLLGNGKLSRAGKDGDQADAGAGTQMADASDAGTADGAAVADGNPNGTGGHGQPVAEQIARGQARPRKKLASLEAFLRDANPKPRSTTSNCCPASSSAANSQKRSACTSATR